MKILCTLSGGEFTPAHVQALARQCAEFAPGHEFVCITNHAVPGVKTLPQSHPTWTGWWVEMEMFRPDIEGPFLYLDIDTVVVAPMDDIMAQTEVTLLRDAYRDGQQGRIAGLQDSVMMLPEAARAPVWKDWISNVNAHMRRRGAMQALFQDHWLNTAKIWQEILPGQLVSWKVNCARGVPAGARVIFFHGRPRPWDVPQFKRLYI